MRKEGIQMILVNEYAVYVETQDGRALEFEMAVHVNQAAQVPQYAREWLATRGIRSQNIKRSHYVVTTCRPVASPLVKTIHRQGYYVKPLKGFVELAS